MRRQHLDTLIGGPADGRPFVLQGHKPYVAIPAIHARVYKPEDALSPYGPSYDTEYYERREFALGGGRDEFGHPRPARRLTFFAHSSLDGQQACEKLWDRLMELAGARELP